MPPNTRKSKVVEAENHGMVLRKHRQSSVLPPTAQRKAFNEIGNVVRRFDARASISVDFLKDSEKTCEAKPNPPLRKSVALVSTTRQRMSVKAPDPVAVEGRELRKSTRDLTALAPPNCRSTSDTSVNKPTGSFGKLLPPPSDWKVKAKSSAGVTLKKGPRLTMKAPVSPPENSTSGIKKRESVATRPHHRLTLKPLKPQLSVEAKAISNPVLPEFKLQSVRPLPKRHEKKKKQLDISVKHDIDLMHQGCPWMVSTYAKHIYSYLQKLEFKLSIRKSLVVRPGVADEMRASMVEWLACIYHQLRLLQETYLLSVSLLDRYLMGAETVDKDKLQLVTLICLSLGIKFEEAIPGSIKEMLKLTKEPYTKEQFLKMEGDVIQVLDFQISRPVSITFLRRYNLAARCDRVQHTYGKYLIDLAQLDRDLAYERPSCLAAAAVYVGLCITKCEVSSHLWNPVLCHYTSFDFQEIQPVVSRMATMAITGGRNHDSIRKRYSSESNYRVAEKIELQLSLLQKLR